MAESKDPYTTHWYTVPCKNYHSMVFSTSRVPDEVTCKTCRKLMKLGDAPKQEANQVKKELGVQIKDSPIVLSSHSNEFYDEFNN